MTKNLEYQILFNYLHVSKADTLKAQGIIFSIMARACFKVQKHQTVEKIQHLKY